MGQSDAPDEPRFGIEETRRSSDWLSRLLHLVFGFVLVGGAFFIVIGLPLVGYCDDEARALRLAAMIASVLGAVFALFAVTFRGAAWRWVGEVLEVVFYMRW